MFYPLRPPLDLDHRSISVRLEKSLSLSLSLSQGWGPWVVTGRPDVVDTHTQTHTHQRVRTSALVPALSVIDVRSNIVDFRHQVFPVAVVSARVETCAGEAGERVCVEGGSGEGGGSSRHRTLHITTHSKPHHATHSKSLIHTMHTLHAPPPQRHSSSS